MKDSSFNAEILRNSINTLNVPTKNTVKFKTLCLVMFICTGDYFYYKAGTTNVTQDRTEFEKWKLTKS